MRAKRWFLTTALSAALLVAPVPSAELLPGHRSAEIPALGVEEAYAAECRIEICFEVDLKIVSGKVCFSKEFSCQ